jgi:transposase
MTNYIGLDAHAATSTFVVLDAQGNMISRRVVKTTEENLVGFLKALKGKTVLTFEETHLAQWLFVILREHVDELIVCNPTHLPKKKGPKTDFRDALEMAHLLRSGHLVGVYHDESHWIQLRSLMSGYEDLNEEIIGAKNRLKAIFRAEAINTDASNFYETARERSKELSHDSARFVVESLFLRIEFLEKQKLDFRSQFMRNRKAYPQIRNLDTIPGFGVVRSNIVAAIVCMPNRFKNKHKFWGYCMLVRHIQISDGRIYGNKRVFGRYVLKDIFLGAAESAMRTDTSLRKYYDDLRAKGVGAREAKLAVARKIAAICLSILKNNGTFQDSYDEQQRSRTEIRKTLNKAV